MRGLLVVGGSLEAGEAEVADACADVLGAARVDAVGALNAVASPVVAARHEGRSIEADIAERVRAAADDAPVVVNARGGVLAALTGRFTVRDLAADLRLPVVVAVAASPDLTGLARLNAEAARSAGLTVAAIVVTGWPDPPSRVLLDELSLLDEGPVPVYVHPGGGTLPADDWLQAAPAPSAPEQEGGPVTRASVALDRYREWEPKPTGDPRDTPRPRIMEGLLEIVAAEGPILADRAYALYNRASGGKKLTSAARAPLSSAAYWLAREGRIVMVSADDVPEQGQDLFRTPDTPAVVVRELGPRNLDEVPLDEIAELMNRLRAARHPSGNSVLKRYVLDTYGLVRMTAKADEYLNLALELADR